VKTSESAAAAAAFSVDVDRFRAGFDELLDRIAPRFARCETLRNAGALMLGLVSDLGRKNCWTLAERAGHSSPDRLQHLLARAVWDTDGVRDDLRAHVVDHLGDADAVLVVDETGDLKKGSTTVGVQRQYSGTAGRIENSQVAVYLAYAAPFGHALIDRRLYLPKAWCEDTIRRQGAGVPDGVKFATKPALAAQMITAAIEADVPAGWVAGDEVYGADPELRADIAALGLGQGAPAARAHGAVGAVAGSPSWRAARSRSTRFWASVSGTGWWAFLVPARSRATSVIVAP
jgi:SRSO17 transposase